MAKTNFCLHTETEIFSVTFRYLLIFLVIVTEGAIFTCELYHVFSPNPNPNANPNPKPNPKPKRNSKPKTLTLMMYHICSRLWQGERQKGNGLNSTLVRIVSEAVASVWDGAEVALSRTRAVKTASGVAAAVFFFFCTVYIASGLSLSLSFWCFLAYYLLLKVFCVKSSSPQPVAISGSKNSVTVLLLSRCPSF